MPGQFEGILDKLQTKLGKQTIKRASTIARPKPRPDVIQIQAINDFVRRNPKADGGSVNGSEQAAFRAKVEELMDDGYEFGEAVREAMRQGYDEGGKVSKAFLKKINNTKGIFYVPSKGEIKVRNYSRNKEGTGTKYQADKRFRLKDYKTPALALQAAKKYHYDTVLSPEAKSKRMKTASEKLYAANTGSIIPVALPAAFTTLPATFNAFLTPSGISTFSN